MFIRQKNNESGTVSIQIIDKSRGRYKIVKTIGTSMDPLVLDQLNIQAKAELIRLQQQLNFNFDIGNEKELVDLIFKGIEQIRLVGPELILGKIFDEIGFNSIKDELFRHLVITRLSYPVSKLKTTDYLFKCKGISIDVERIYRYLDKLHSKQKERIQEISYAHTLKVQDKTIKDVFYYLTTLCFEAEDPDDLRISGFSKEDKHPHPQILLGLLVNIDGYPLAYEIFEGSKVKAQNMIPALEAFKTKYRLKNLVVVADAGLLSDESIAELEKMDYPYIIEARLQRESLALQSKILKVKIKDEQCKEIVIDREKRLMINFSQARAKKDKSNRQRGIEKLERAIKKGQLSKENINHRGYNKYLKLAGDVGIRIDYEKFKRDERWDGLKGYMTNTKLSNDQVIEQYDNMGKIEKAFRMSKTDLHITPIFHRLRRRVEAHICLAFCAYKIYNELERRLKYSHAVWSPEKAIEIANTVFEVTITTPFSRNREARLHLQNEEQTRLLDLFKP